MIQLQGVTRSYSKGQNQVNALLEVNLNIASGEHIALVGPSGAGKSTLLSLLGLMDQPSSGKVMFEGQDTSSLPDAELSRLRGRRIGFVFQAFNLLPALNAWQNVALPMMYAGIPLLERKKKALEVLDRVGMLERANHRPHELSGGQEQRVAIARALVMQPPLILADEPTGNLDAANGMQVLALLDELNRNGTTLITVTHSAEVAAHAHKVLTVRDGILLGMVN